MSKPAIPDSAPSFTSAAVSRRRVLATTGAAFSTAGLTVLAGCTTRTASGEPVDTLTPTPTPTATPTPTPSPTPTSTPGETPSDVRARAILARAPFGPPRNIDLFASGVYPEASPAELPPPRVIDEDDIRTVLETVMEARYAGRADRVTRVGEAMALFDDPRLVEVMPSPVLRAATVNLKGTVGEPAIDAYLGNYEDYPSIVTVQFDPEVSIGSIGKVQTLLGASRDIIVLFSAELQYEDFRGFTPFMAHEVLHHDPINNEREEVICDAIEAFIWGQLVLEDPTLFGGNSFLSVSKNTDLLARLNSRDETGRMTIRGGAGPVFPGGKRGYGSITGYGDVMDFTRGDDPDYTDWADQPYTQGNVVLVEIIAAMTGRRDGWFTFSDRAIEFIDDQTVLSPADQVRLFGILTVPVN